MIHADRRTDIHADRNIAPLYRGGEVQSIVIDVSVFRSVRSQTQKPLGQILCVLPADVAGFVDVDMFSNNGPLALYVYCYCYPWR